MHIQRLTGILIAVSLLWALPAFAGDAETRGMEDSLARGYLAASKNDVKGSAAIFAQTIPLAEKAESWRGLVDIGNAFSALGMPERSSELFEKAERIAAAQKDWRGLVAVAYGYAGIPQNDRTKKSAGAALESAATIASTGNEWRGCVETAKAFDKLGMKDKAAATLGSAKKIAASLRSGAAASQIGTVARELGYPAIGDECVKMVKEFGDNERAAATPPPPGWQPYGESVAGPQKIRVEAQKAMRESADNDVRSKREYLAQIQKQEAKADQYYRVFRNYYDYPYQCSYFGFGAWQPLGAAQVASWGAYYFSRYRLADNVYVY